ncbi:TadE/TadG family type IV pilus assembly protein [Yoonia sp. MH D7]
MTAIFQKPKRLLQRFFRRNDGSATIELVILLPVFMMLFMSAYEGGMISMRHMMMERGLDLAVRDVRIGKVRDPKHEDLKKQICDYAQIIPDCQKQLQLEMTLMDVRAWSDELDGPILCIDRDEDTDPDDISYANGDNNQLMVLQVCVLFDPVVPTTGLGKSIPKQSGGAYALTATTAFVMEPFR